MGSSSFLIDSRNQIIYYIYTGKIDMKKTITIIFSLILFSNLLFSQSLLELAEKEESRRAKLKGKKAVVVTNADLKNLKRRPALTVIKAPLIEGRLPVYPIEKIEQEDLEDQKRLEGQWKMANESADLLTLRMNELQQRFFSFENLYDRAEMQREFTETYQKLQQAQQEAIIAKRELDRQRTKKRR